MTNLKTTKAHAHIVSETKYKTVEFAKNEMETVRYL